MARMQVSEICPPKKEAAGITGSPFKCQRLR
jgi:hypothetical protein